MFKSSASKLFFGFLLIFPSACSFWRAGETPTPSATPFVTAEIKSDIPFSTREPEVYQTEIISRNFAGSNTSERKIFAARNGTKRLTIFDVGERNETSLLELGANQNFSILPGKKIYAGNQPGEQIESESADDFLTTEWLNQKTAAAFESLGTENGLSKFRVSLGTAETSNSEILIYIDENFKIPIRQEFYRSDGEQKTLTFSVEMKNFKAEADEKFFELPKDYRQVSPKEFQEVIRQERIKNE